ncbi:MAG: hypothetical protein ACE5HN_05300, partial [Nitrospiria bacterium]
MVWVRIFILIFFGMFLGGAQIKAADVFLGTSRFGFEKIPLMIYPFEGSGEDAEEVLLAETVLRADLDRTQLFRIVEASRIGSTTGPVGAPGLAVLSEASAKGVQALAWAKMYTRNEEWVLESHAYETTKKQEVIAVKIIGGEKSIRTMAHRFSDKLVHHFTGEKGIAQTKVTYVSDLSGKKEVYI